MDINALSKLTDQELAEYHAGWKEHSKNAILCQYEWQRRAQLDAFRLAERISMRERVSTLAAAAFGVAATLAGVWLAR